MTPAPSKTVAVHTQVIRQGGFDLPHFTYYVKQSMLQTMKTGIKIGQLEFIDTDGKTYIFGDVGIDSKDHKTLDNRNRQPRKAVIRVLTDEFYSLVARTYDIGFAEAYMLGAFTTPDLKAIFDVWLDNRESLSNLQTISAWLYTAASGLWNRFFAHSKVHNRLSAITGYDTCNALFEAMLDESMMYSCYQWDDDLGGPRGDLAPGYVLDTEADRIFNEAAKRKTRYMLNQARVRPGDRVLEFGSGWGGMAMEAAQMGCTVDTLTLSVQQKVFADSRIAAAGFSGQARVHLLNFRDLPDKFPEFHHAFDAFISSEMLAHVGERHLGEYFRVIDWAMKPKSSAICLSETTCPEHRWSLYQAEDYARRYQWPNVYLPSPTSIPQTVQREIPGKFVFQAVEDFGVHYPRTLREWRLRFERGWTPELIKLLQEEHPGLRNEDLLASFRRKWEYMFLYAEVGYARAYTSVSTWTFSRPEYPRVVCD